MSIVSQESLNKKIRTAKIISHVPYSNVSQYGRPFSCSFSLSKLVTKKECTIFLPFYNTKVELYHTV